MGKLRAVDFRFLVGCIAALCASSAIAQSVNTSEASCAALAGTSLTTAKVTSAMVVPAATALPDASVGPSTLRIMPAFCRVKITDKPSPDSDIKTEIWLPLAGWNGRYRGTGNGGFAGAIAYDQMAVAVKDGYVSAGTDTGHVGQDPKFALAHPEKIKDFGWRAIHDMTVETKLLVKALYGKQPEHSYFTACSDGGREALMEAQRFPDDYDGILAGAPGYNWTALISSGAADEKQLQSAKDSMIPVKKLPAIANAVRLACDAQDGLKDGILNDPRTCSFDPGTLVCKGADADSCLLPDQVESLRTIYATKKDASGKKIYPGYAHGAEDARGSWDGWLLGDHAALKFFGAGFFGDFVYERPDWAFKDFDFDRDYKLATEKEGPSQNATDPNLKPFAAHGGKLVMYHGWNDPAIPAQGTIDYYENAMTATGEVGTSSTMRLYMVPGMLHCGGGPGVTLFSEDGTGARGDAQHDIFTALEQWVEKGSAPGTLIASKFVDDDAAKGVGATRPLCAYPAVTTYVKGDPNDAKSFACVGGTK